MVTRDLGSTARVMRQGHFIMHKGRVCETVAQVELSALR